MRTEFICNACLQSCSRCFSHKREYIINFSAHTETNYAVRVHVVFHHDDQHHDYTLVDRRTVVDNYTLVDRSTMVDNYTLVDRRTMVDNYTLVDRRTLVDNYTLVDRRTVVDNYTLVDRHTVVGNQCSPLQAVVPINPRPVDFMVAALMPDWAQGKVIF